MVGDNVKEEERRSSELGEQVFIDLTVGEEEDEEAVEKEAEEEGLLGVNWSQSQRSHC
jgi:hypothetical protein